MGMAFDRSKLRGRIVEKYGSQKAFAETLNMSDRTMSLKMNNVVAISQEEIVEWCELLELRDEDIPEYFFKK